MTTGDSLARLFVVREFLTETFLRPPAGGIPRAASETSGFGVFRQLHTIMRSPRPNQSVVGFGIGQTHGQAEPTLCVFAEPDFEHRRPLDETLRRLGLHDVEILLGRFEAAARPIGGGEELGHGSSAGQSGTMGCVVEDASNDRFALSCNHVIADLNRAVRGTTETWAPGSASGGTAKDRLGVVHEFVDLDFSGGYNDVDVALAKPDNVSDLDTKIRGIGAIKGPASSIAFGDRVKKSGAVTGVTYGKYRYQINGLVNYGGGSQALFRDLLGIIGTSSATNFADRGDSGAVLINDNDEVVGQLIAVSSGIDLALATPIDPVLNKLGIRLI